MSLESVAAAIRERLHLAHDVRARALFDFGEDGVVFVDNTGAETLISHDPVGEADVSLACSLELFQGFLDGTKDPNVAYLTGRLKIRGSLGLAMKLNAALDG